MVYKSASLNILSPRVGTGEGAAADPSGEGVAVWTYRSDDAFAVVEVAGYIDDGADKGMRVGDSVIVVENGAAVTLGVVTVVDTSSNPAGDVTLT